MVHTMIICRRGVMPLCLMLCGCAASAQTAAPDQPQADFHANSGEFALTSSLADLLASVRDHTQLSPTIMAGLSELAEDLRTAGAFAVILTGPANALFVDGQDRRVGTVGGESINEIPDAMVVATGAAQWYNPPANLPPEMRPVSLAEDSVVKEATFGTGKGDNGRLTGVGSVFAFGTKRVILHLRFEDAPAKTELFLTWMYEGKALLHQIIEATGSGGALLYLMAVSKPEIWAGNHAVIIRENGRQVGTATFVVR